MKLIFNRVQILMFFHLLVSLYIQKHGSSSPFSLVLSKKVFLFL
uniref:Uncharacterized protein n=1 Tax=Lepeophtheirus salmonis TaxID=72036 RepID=A0A0K2UTG2_LEPSM